MLDLDIRTATATEAKKLLAKRYPEAQLTSRTIETLSAGSALTLSRHHWRCSPAPAHPWLKSIVITHALYAAHTRPCARSPRSRSPAAPHTPTDLGDPPCGIAHALYNADGFRKNLEGHARNLRNDEGQGDGDAQRPTDGGAG